MSNRAKKEPKKRNGKAAFLDRDGTVIEDVGYLSRPDQVRVLPGVPAALKSLRDLGMALVVVSNQSGVARGMFSIADVEAANARMKRLLDEEDVGFDAIYYCPHISEDKCGCRKPASGMIERAEVELGINPRLSYVIGDRVADVGLARSVGAKAALVLTGYGKETLKEIQGAEDQPDFVAADLSEAVEWIKKTENGG